MQDQRERQARLRSQGHIRPGQRQLVFLWMEAEHAPHDVVYFRRRPVLLEQDVMGFAERVKAGGEGIYSLLVADILGQ